MAVAYWVEQLGKDDKKAVDDHKAKAMDREIERYLEDLGKAGLGPIRGDQWVWTGFADGS